MMRVLCSLFLLGLLLPGFVLAQETAPIIAVQPYLRNQDIYLLRQGENPALLFEADTPEVVLSPDGQRIAVLDYPAFVRIEEQLEPGDYPDDLIVIDVTTGEQHPLLFHDDHTTLSTGEHFYNGDYRGGVSTSRAWDDPNAAFGGRLAHFLAWSPDSSQIAQVQTVVDSGHYPGKVRIVRYDVETGDLSVIAELGQPEVGYAVFWFDAGIVLYADQAEGNDTVTVYSPDGEELYQWELAAGAVLAHENPVRYEGRDFLAFTQWSLLDVATGERTPIEGTIALVSASSSSNGLLLEACDDREALRPTWDVYRAGGEKLANLRHIGVPTISPDGTQVVYVDYDANRTITLYDEGGMQPFGEAAFSGEPVLWGATIYTITTMGIEDCGRAARG